MVSLEGHPVNVLVSRQKVTKPTATRFGEMMDAEKSFRTLGFAAIGLRVTHFRIYKALVDGRASCAYVDHMLKRMKRSMPFHRPSGTTIPSI